MTINILTSGRVAVFGGNASVKSRRLFGRSRKTLTACWNAWAGSGERLMHRVLDETVVKMMTVAVVTGSSHGDDVRDDISSVPPPKKRIRHSGSSSASTSESPSHLDLSQSPPPLWLLWPEVVERAHRNDEYDPYSITYRAVRFGLDGSHADGGINHGS